MNEVIYHGAFKGLVPAASATDVLVIVGSATKTVRVKRITLTGIATAAGTFHAVLIRRSADDTAGTSTNATAVPREPGAVAATAVIRGYTGNPSALGTAVGTIAAQYMGFGTAATQLAAPPTVFDFGESADDRVTLRAATDLLALNLDAQTITGGLIDATVEWAER